MIEGRILQAEGKLVDGRWDYGHLPNTQFGNVSESASKRAVSKVATILTFAPDLAAPVTAGDLDLENAYRDARDREAMSKEQSSGEVIEEVPASSNGDTGNGDTAVKIRRKVKKAAVKQKFNRVNDNIGWSTWSWNPITGCDHGCPYCYAREISENFQRRGIPGYENGFEVTFHPNRLDAPANTICPTHADSADDSDRRVFVCSMSDLFSKKVENGWIEQIFQACSDNPQWEYLFLTKNPHRMSKVTFPDGAWAGTSVDRQKRVTTAMHSMEKVDRQVPLVVLRAAPGAAEVPRPLHVQPGGDRGADGDPPDQGVPGLAGDRTGVGVGGGSRRPGAGVELRRVVEGEPDRQAPSPVPRHDPASGTAVMTWEPSRVERVRANTVAAVLVLILAFLLAVWVLRVTL